MQLASHGARGIARVPNVKAGGHAARSIHIPTYARVVPADIANPSAAKRIVSQTRTLLSRFIGHLITPGIGQASHAASPLVQAVRGAAPGRMSTIQQRMSLPVRNALSRPIQPLYFPHAPTFASRSVAQVGLGTARSFHSGRSVFQNLVENVPIAGRAFYEADWQVDMKTRRESMRKRETVSAAEKKSKEMLKPKLTVSSLGSSLETSQENQPSVPEMDKYFAAPVIPNVTTYLLIPLAPTPTNRTPLDPNGSGPSLLPYTSLASIHNGHELHALRVSSLFSRLDAANVWDRNVICSPYATHADLEGVCTILKVEFIGWTGAEVRSVIGEAGTGWCALEEEFTKPERDDEDAFSDTSSILSGISGEIPASAVATPPWLEESSSATDSFVLPTLDFSSSFLGGNVQESSQISRSSSTTDLFSEVNMEYEDPWSDAALSESESEIWSGGSGRLGFSYEFSRRSIEDDGPREVLF
ncbi:hypothetical protein Moror_1304 [Moniliophthora roreri MCA 2997]|uniref:Uncharacterized protein n=2 Tax=Moniliophthora roreri TaxID=221103 RepID=V2WN50_MONRO|nr:hypothetical protein Moror_1304 [Moniliophthora roreri MCA 2997]